MSTSDDAIRARLRALSTSAERTLFRRLSDLLPDIEAAVEAGVPRSAIVDALNAEGIAVTPKTFTVYLHRLRARKRPVSMPPLPSLSAMPPTPATTTQSTASSSACAPNTTRTTEGTTQ